MINLDRLDEYPIISVDIESTGLHWYRDKMFGVAIAAYDGQKIHTSYFDIRTKPKIITLLKDKLHKVKKLVNHSIRFDCHFLMNEGVEVPFDRIECTMTRAALINEHELSFSLDSLCKKYVGAGKVEVWAELATMFGGAPTKEVQIKNLHRAPESLAGKYTSADPELAIKLWLWQEKEIKAQDLGQVWDLERRLTPILVQIERQGVRVDEERAHKSIKDINVSVAFSNTALAKITGKEVNVNSPLQMRKLFGVENRDGNWFCGNYALEKTGCGEASIGADALRSLDALGDKRAKLVLNLRKMTKANSFLKDHIIGHAVDGRVYPTYNQARSESGFGTGTGRFSINDPALQQIPARDKEIAAIVRSCFIPDHGNEWGCFDFSQFEQRWFAHYAKDENVYRMYEDNPKTDFYQAMSDLTGLPRNPQYAGQANAKQMTLAAIFGMGAGKLAKEMGMSYKMEEGRDGKVYYKAGDDAIAVMNQFHEAVPGIRDHLNRATAIAKSRGYIKTIMNRHIRFPNGMGAHKAGGLVLQGSAADCLKLKMIKIHEIIKGTGIKMLLSVHDEIDMDVPPHAKHLTDAMVQAYTTFDGDDAPLCKVPIICNADYGKNWYDASR